MKSATELVMRTRERCTARRWPKRIAAACGSRTWCSSAPEFSRKVKQSHAEWCLTWLTAVWRLTVRAGLYPTPLGTLGMTTPSTIRYKPFHSQAQNVHSPKLLKRKCIGDEVRIGSVIIIQLSELWKAKFFILCDLVFLVRVQAKLGIDHS